MDTQIYVVNELVVLTDNQFDIYNTTHLVTQDLELAKAKLDQIINIAAQDFNQTVDDIIIESEYEKIVSRADNYDRIEVKIETVDIK